MNLAAQLVKLLGYRQRNGTAYAAADNGYLLQSVRMRGSAERSHKILNIVALILVIKQLG